MIALLLLLRLLFRTGNTTTNSKLQKMFHVPEKESPIPAVCTGVAKQGMLQRRVSLIQNIAERLQSDEQLGELLLVLSRPPSDTVHFWVCQ